MWRDNATTGGEIGMSKVTNKKISNIDYKRQVDRRTLSWARPWQVGLYKHRSEGMPDSLTAKQS